MPTYQRIITLFNIVDLNLDLESKSYSVLPNLNFIVSEDVN